MAQLIVQVKLTDAPYPTPLQINQARLHMDGLIMVDRIDEEWYQAHFVDTDAADYAESEMAAVGQLCTNHFETLKQVIQLKV